VGIGATRMGPVHDVRRSFLCGGAQKFIEVNHNKEPRVPAKGNPRVGARSAYSDPLHPGGATTAGPSGSRWDCGATSGRSNSTRRRNRPMGRAIRSARPGLSPTATAMTDMAQSCWMSPLILTGASFPRLGYWIVDRERASPTLS
jgi:hypothetical protein